MSQYSKFSDKMSKAENFMAGANRICLEISSKAEEAKDDLEELTGWVREVALAIETNDTSSIFSCFGADGEFEWNKDYIVFRLRDLIGECYPKEPNNEQ